MCFYYFDALAGAGKTRALARYTDRIARRGCKVLFIQPTKHLIDKTVEDELQPLDPPYPYRVLHGNVDLDGASVVAEIVRHFQDADPEQGEVLFITHAAFLRVPYLQGKANWHLIMDEVPQADVFEEWKLPETHDLILPHLSFVPMGSVYGRLEAVRQDVTSSEEDAR
ncbi:DEAD/DEAH box helicase family protein [Methylorubrum extorquens]|uniref:DEAD/DEAH box helicase family protein n=1 Tax=Methylorubrum extorquens TaxID=408 RepID=UPI00015B98BD|nr:DEAD/DEAH box helicase family protein [Methylorubrum extorquens]